VVGVGSVGTRAWVVLLQGDTKRDVLVLQAKEAQRSVLEPPEALSAYAHQGERVVQGQKVIYIAFFNSYPPPDGQVQMLTDIDRSLLLATNATIIAKGWPDHDLFGEYP